MAEPTVIPKAFRRIAGTCFFMFVVAVLAACENDDIPNSAVLMGIGYSSESYEERFGSSAFRFLKGKDREAAIVSLENDGFNCDGNTCALTTVFRDSTYDVIFGLKPPNNKSNLLGPRKVVEFTYTVDILETPLTTRSDISTRVERLEDYQ